MAFGDADASTPAYVKASVATKDVTTASFTPPVGAWLVAFAVHDTAGGNLTNTSAVTDSQAGTWSQVVVHSKQSDGAGANNGHIAVSARKITSSVAMTVKTTGTNTNNPAGLYVRVITGADAVTVMDATPTEGHNVNAVISLAITVATTGARVFIIASDWNLAANMTAGASQTAIVSDGIGAPDMRFYVGVQNATSSAGAVTMSTATPTTGNQNNYAVIAVRPAAGGGAPSGDAALAVTASFGTAAIVQDIGASGLAVTATVAVGTSATVAKPVASSLALTASVSVSATRDVPVAASLAVVASVAATAVPSRIAAAALAITAAVSTSAASAKPADASLAVTATIAATAAVGVLASLNITATVSASAVPTRVGAASLAIVWAATATATPTRVGGASVSVAVTIATTIVDSRTTTAALALTVALVASASVGGAEVPVQPGTIRWGDVAIGIRAADNGGAIRPADVQASPVGVTERAGVIHGV